MENVVLAEEFARARRPDAGRLLRRHPRRPDHPPVGHRGAEEAVPAQDPEGRDRRGARASPSPTPAPTSPRSRPPPCSTATSGSSTARRSGPPRPSSPTTASCWPAPTRTCRSTPASPTCSCRCSRTASRCAASSSPTAPPSSTRCSSPTPAARRRTSSAASTTAGRWRTPPSASSGACRPPPATAASRRSSTSSSSRRQGERQDRRPDRSARASRSYYSKIQILRINGLRSLTGDAHGTKDLGVAALGATNKMFWSEMHRDAMELALDIFGADADARRHAADDRGLARAGHAAPRRRGTVLPGAARCRRVLLLPLRDDLGRHRRDPAQHRRRASSSACRRSPSPRRTAQRLRAGASRRDWVGATGPRYRRQPCRASTSPRAGRRSLGQRALIAAGALLTFVLLLSRPVRPTSTSASGRSPASTWPSTCRRRRASPATT